MRRVSWQREVRIKDHKYRFYYSFECTQDIYSPDIKTEEKKKLSRHSGVDAGVLSDPVYGAVTMRLSVFSGEGEWGCVSYNLPTNYYENAAYIIRF